MLACIMVCGNRALVVGNRSVATGCWKTFSHKPGEEAGMTWTDGDQICERPLGHYSGRDVLIDSAMEAHRCISVSGCQL